MALRSLLQLHQHTGDERYRTIALQGLDRMAGVASRVPSAFGMLLLAGDYETTEKV